MALKFLDLTGLTYFKSKLNIPSTSDIQALINTALADYTTSVDIFTVVSTLPASGVEGRGYFVPNANDSTKYDLYTWENNAWVSSPGGSITITIDATPTQGSSNAVSSGGVYTALQGKLNTTDLVAITNSEIDNLFV